MQSNHLEVLDTSDFDPVDMWQPPNSKLKYEPRQVVHMMNWLETQEGTTLTHRSKDNKQLLAVSKNISA